MLDGITVFSLRLRCSIKDHRGCLRHQPLLYSHDDSTVTGFSVALMMCSGIGEESDSLLHVVVINPRRTCAARVTVLGLCVCVCVSVQSNLRSCANTRATRNTYGFSVARIVKIKSRFLLKCFVQKLESYLLTVAKSAIFCAYSCV